MLARVLFCFVVCISLIGCKPAVNPGTWDQTRVEAKLKEKYNLVEISLKSASEGELAGTGKTAQGETYTFKVKQNAELKRLSWEFNSDRGDVGDEVLEIVKIE